ncbi:YcjX family GTP-binding protein [Thalassotalea agarivorans]|uniref:YcjX family protein n=1 Tax=Thalassotalea agarivorans TaxID=349064 RepID=A0A1H9ZR38_THASX|nr:YcjX family protein [Thalassotalea agarivorans]SES84145.1 hypothetical protein SAMN05660429_00556 [Thalassotalea agarivorans]
MAIISKTKLKKLKHSASDLLQKSLDQHVTLAVTGLSRSGKTAFITSLVNQLLNEGNGSELSFFNPVHQGRYIAAKRVNQKHFHIPRFDYETAMQAFTQDPVQWPQPTKGISELRLAIKYRPASGLLKYTSDTATLTLDITDYPGEWLLDLPMLKLTYEEWSERMLELMKSEPRAEVSQAFIDEIKEIDPLAPCSEEVLAQLAEKYTALLHQYRDELGLSIIQPGRFILPGELENAPILQFFPYTSMDELDYDSYIEASGDSFIGMLRARYLEYRERVVKKFYKEHFVHFDRQIILADCLTPLNQGEAAFHELSQAISLIMESFDYGKSGFLRRLFSPKIDRLLFAATKADHVTVDQHGALVSLLNQLVHSSKHELDFEQIQMKTLALSSVKTTKNGKSMHQGKTVPVIQGHRLDDGQLITVFPGSVPSKLPEQQYWQNKAFNFISFAPIKSPSAHTPLPHMRLDQALQFLLGDKLA